MEGPLVGQGLAYAISTTGMAALTRSPQTAGRFLLLHNTGSSNSKLAGACVLNWRQSQTGTIWGARATRGDRYAQVSSAKSKPSSPTLSASTNAILFGLGNPRKLTGGHHYSWRQVERPNPLTGLLLHLSRESLKPKLVSGIGYKPIDALIAFSLVNVLLFQKALTISPCRRRWGGMSARRIDRLGACGRISA